MEKSLKKRTVNGLFWSFIDNSFAQIIQFGVGIILARLLSPHDFGLIGMITIFITISQWFVNSGFGPALIRKTNCTSDDYSTVFIYNIIAGIVLYVIIFLSAPLISNFFEEPELIPLVKVVALSLIIISFTIVQQTQLTKRLDFKLQTRISVISAVIGGGIAIIMAYNGFGVWSLVYKTLIENTIRTILLWFFSKWRPKLVFSKESFKDLFGFGYKLMLRGLIYTVFNNIYRAVIGKYFSTNDLGYYTKAEQFSNLPSTNITQVVNRVAYPALSEVQDDKVKLKSSYRTIYVSLFYLTSVMMITLCALAEPVIITLIGEKWRESILFLQLLSIIGLLYPLCDFNLTLLKIVGKSDLILKLEIFKRIISIPLIIFGVFAGIKYLLLGMILLSVLEFIANGYFSGKYISYTLKQQLIDVLPTILLCIFVGISVYLFSQFLDMAYWIILLLGLLLSLVLIIVISELFRNKGYLAIKQVILEQIKKIRRNG